MLKRIGAVAVMVVMLFTVLCNFAFVGAEENIMQMVLTPSAVKAKRGETVTVAVSLENYQTVQGVGLLVDYDKDVLTYTGEAFKNFSGVEGGDYISDFDSLQFTNTNYKKDDVNEILAAWVSADNFVLSETAAGKLNLWSVTFTVNEDAVIDESVLNFSLAETFMMYWDEEQAKSIFLEPGIEYVQSAAMTVEVYCEHNYGEWQVVEDPTFTTEGKKQRTCSLCGDVEEGVVPILPSFELKPGNAKACIGAEWTVELAVKHNPGISSAMLQIEYDDTAMKLTAATAPGATTEISEDAHEIAVASATGLYGEETIVTLTFTVDEEATAGNYNVTVSANNAVDNAEAPQGLVIGSSTTAVEILDYRWGDVTENGTVDSADAVAIIQYVVGTRTAEELPGVKAADANFNNEITLADAVCILRYLVSLYTPHVAM
jgi:hypothetical protein